LRTPEIMANIQGTISALNTRHLFSLKTNQLLTLRRPQSALSSLSINFSSLKTFHSAPTTLRSSVITSATLTSPPTLTHTYLSSQIFSVKAIAPTRCFTTSLPLESLQRFKKAGDVEAASKAKREGRWQPPKKAVKSTETPEEAALKKMTSEEMERWLAKRPVDNVWLKKHYPERVFTLEKIVEMNRQANHPSMLDNPDGDLMVELSLNMQGVKATKPIKAFSTLTHVPFKSPHTTCEPRDVAVIVKNVELQSQMEERGARYVGGEELILKLKNGLIQKDSDYDYLIAHMDIIQELGSLLKKKHAYLMPTEKDGTLGVNLLEMFDLHQNGYLLNVKSNGDDPMKGSVTFSLGKLSHSLSQMHANLDVIMKILRIKRPANLTPKRGVFITGATIRCPPNSEVFSWDYEALNEFVDDVEAETVLEKESAESDLSSAQNL